MRKAVCLILGCFIWLNILKSQQIYTAVNGLSGTSIWLVDAGDCTRTEIISGISPEIDDFVEVPGGNFIMVSSPNSGQADFYSIDPSSGATTLLTTLFSSGSYPSRLLLVSPTEVLWAVRGRFYILNLTDNSLTLIATYPLSYFTWHLFTHNGQIYYGEESIPGSFNETFYTLSLTPTFSRTFYATLPGDYIELSNLSDVAEACDQLYSDGNPQLMNYNLTNFTTGVHCAWENSSSSPPVAPLLSGTSGPTCGCTSDAGTWSYNISQDDLVEACAGGIINLPHSGDEVLSPGQNLSFALYEIPFTGLNFYDNLNSSNLLHVYPSTQLNFIPGVTEVNTVYLVVPIASAAPPGSFNLDDPCRDIQIRLYVRWLTPTVSFTEINPVTCGSGCRTLRATFQGSPPFSLNYSVNPSSNGQIQTFTKTFSANTGTFEVCPPPGYEGGLEVKALGLIDANGCTCN